MFDTSLVCQLSTIHRGVHKSNSPGVSQGPYPAALFVRSPKSFCRPVGYTARCYFTIGESIEIEPRMSLIATFDDASIASTSSVSSDSSLSPDDSLPSTVPSRVPSSSRASALSRKRRAANVLPNIGFDGDASRRAPSSVNSPADGLSSQESDDGSKRLRSSQGSDSSRSVDQIAQLECSQGSVSSSSPVSGSKKIEHIVEGYEIFPVGKEFTAIHTETKAVMQVIVFNTGNECAQYQRVVSRLNEAERFSNRTASDIQRMREMIIPKGCDFRKSEVNGRFYLFCPMYHASLHALAQRKRPPSGNEEQIQKLFRQIVELVAFCHEIGINMRDLKLRKFVAVDKDFNTLRLNSVLDLIVYDDPSNDMIRDRQGCPAYVAPEILSIDNAEYAGRPADMWALGVLLYVLLTGRYPFYDATPQLLFQRIKIGRFQVPPSACVSPEAKQIFHVLLKTDPNERPTAQELLTMPWFQGLRDPEVSRLHSWALDAFAAIQDVAGFNLAAAAGARRQLQELLRPYRARHLRDEDHIVPRAIPRRGDRLHDSLLGYSLRSAVPSRSGSPAASPRSRRPP
ncbi:hypothetical protein QR680_017581 [Steinernema hermaphroditum]|uniref:Protein kinase domain-containing protein n=1 Tax=Steinernema hermaphroditum TaxID=289476 RepID=A0AA39HFQ8_9BILA|nr:hypothetical protein QR680_017581 [Steinernema hermaphroditum]